MRNVSYTMVFYQHHINYFYVQQIAVNQPFKNSEFLGSIFGGKNVMETPDLMRVTGSKVINNSPIIYIKINASNNAAFRSFYNTNFTPKKELKNSTTNIETNLTIPSQVRKN